MKRTISTYLAYAAMAVVVAGWGGMTGAARAQQCATCGGGAAPVSDGGGCGCGSCGCGTCDVCGSCPTCPNCGHPLLEVPLMPIRFVLNTLGDMFRCGGCGCETYYGDDWCCGSQGCCEPCDKCGNYVGGCGRCGPGGLRGLLFGDGMARGTTVSDVPVGGDMVVSGGDMAAGNRSPYNVARASGTCPTCGHSYANSASVPRSNMVSSGSNGNRGYTATASYRGNGNYNGAANANTSANYAATRGNYTNTGRTPSPQVDLSNLPPGRFSPKVISVTDEVVSPANANTADGQTARSAGTTTR